MLIICALLPELLSPWVNRDSIAILLMMFNIISQSNLADSIYKSILNDLIANIVKKRESEAANNILIKIVSK